MAEPFESNTKTMLVFPGQGSQIVGMGKDLYEKYESAAAIFDKAKDVLGFDIKDLCFKGPEEKLKQTKYTQPAIFTHSMAVFAVLDEMGIQYNGAMGHSLGEYGALVATGITDFETALKLVQVRGALMQDADFGNGPMAAVMGLDLDTLKEICASITDYTVEPAIMNGPGQIVIAGHTPGVEKAASMATEKGAKRAIILKTSGPFHSSLMSGAAEKFDAYLSKTELKNSEKCFIPNTTARVTESAIEIKKNLLDQISCTVLWEDSVKRARQNGFDTFIETGPGKVLCGLIRKIDKTGKVFSAQCSVSIEKLFEQNPELFKREQEKCI
jgi:[acyl-carrier-protein] S-malonyltransferase